MRYLILFLFAICCVALTYYFSVVGIVMSFVVAVAAWILIWRIEYLRDQRDKFAYYQDVCNPIFVVGNHPEDDRPVIVPHSDGFVVNVQHDQVYKTAKEIRYWLVKTGNEHYKAGTIAVHERYFREGMFVNERFKKGYVPRVISDFKIAREKTHAALYKANPDYYKAEILGQDGAEYKI